YNLLSIHERFGGTKNLSKRLDTFPASILYLLAAPSTPQEARDEIIARAEAGEEITVAKTKTAIAKRKRKPNQPSPRKAGKRTPADDIIDELLDEAAAEANKPKPRDDIGATSAGEIALKDAEIEDLRNGKRHLEIENTGLRSEIEDLRRENAGLRESL